MIEWVGIIGSIIGMEITIGTQSLHCVQLGGFDMNDNLIAELYEMSSGKFGVKYDDEVLELFTEKSQVFDADTMKKIGQIDCSVTGIFYPHHLPNKLIEMYPNGGDLAFYLLGNSSKQEMLTYVPLHKMMLMGYEVSSNQDSFGYVYYFAKCGEIKGIPVYSYTSDMVIDSKEMKWVSANEMVTVSHSRSAKE